MSAAHSSAAGRRGEGEGKVGVRAAWEDPEDDEVSL